MSGSKNESIRYENSSAFETKFISIWISQSSLICNTLNEINPKFSWNNHIHGKLLMGKWMHFYSLPSMDTLQGLPDFRGKLIWAQHSNRPDKLSEVVKIWMKKVFLFWKKMVSSFPPDEIWLPIRTLLYILYFILISVSGSIEYINCIRTS